MTQRPDLPKAEELNSLPKDGGPDWNRLVFERSPYLLQHAANPVDWYPWGEEAFAKAKAEDKPVFVSIGYATCHWCHVMEHQSFEDEQVAALLNRFCIPVKVDKEERPDVDDIYMTACQALTGQGGWPLNAFLDHEKRPFFVGTYFPKHGVQGRPGMMELLPRIDEVWREQRGDIQDSAERITDHVKSYSGHSPGERLQLNTLNKGQRELRQRFDSEYGGFGDAPKFPTPHNMLFLLRHWKRTGDAAGLEMTKQTLIAMRMGGIFDHVGFGFHRYATDHLWLLPHFEKMLYDQAMLAMAYLECHQATGEAFFAEVAREIFTYVLRDMTAPEGGFYSAEDADSEGEEGKFYVWKPEEIIDILGEEDGKVYCEIYQIIKGGNFADEASGYKTGDSIPHLKASWKKLAERHDMSEQGLRERIEICRQKLFDVREERIHPLKDDKVLTDWNGLMIAAMAMGARILDDAEYAEAASRAADFALRTLRDDDGRLYKRYRTGEAGLTALIDDYAFMIWGLLELYGVTFETSRLQAAIELTEQVEQWFKDDESGAYFLTPSDGEELITRPLRCYDGAIPSGNSVMACQLTRLARITGDSQYETRAHEVIMAFSKLVAQQPTASCQMLQASDALLDPARQLVIAAENVDAAKPMLGKASKHYNPNQVVMLNAGDPVLKRLIPTIEDYGIINNAPTAYVCENFACQKPTNELA